MARAKKEIKRERKGPVALEDLREYTEALEWAVKVRSKAEKEIADCSFTIPQGVLARLDDLTAEGVLTARERDLVTLWNGVGASSHGGAKRANYHTLKEVLQAICNLPEQGADVKTWWTYQGCVRKPARWETQLLHPQG